jgi:hypothetical protein
VCNRRVDQSGQVLGEDGIGGPVGTPHVQGSRILCDEEQNSDNRQAGDNDHGPFAALDRESAWPFLARSHAHHPASMITAAACKIRAMFPFVVAQALAEKGLLDGAITGVSGLFTNITDTVRDKPYLLIVLAIVLALLLKKRR